MKSQSDFGGFHPPFGTRIAQTKVVEIAIRRSALGGWNNEIILLMLRGNRGDWNAEAVPKQMKAPPNFVWRFEEFWNGG
ncbi:MAG: hypothetical protein ACTS53_01580 [Candidatus Hodgkinia cicadicola]